ncbi:MAG: Spy/CpxP family protein refolding chaperone [Geminicoccaceae bacterium]
MRGYTLLVLAALMAPPALADKAPYAGEDARTIKALSPERIEGLRTGAGLGYAKAAELNGWPGPLHALELADALSLTADQRARIDVIRQAMLAKAKPLGEDLVAAEATLDALFADGTPTLMRVAEATGKIGRIEAALRAVHLAAHIDIKPLLTEHQRMLYARQRGYSDSHEGHDKH